MHVGAVHCAAIDDVGTVDGLGAFLTDVAKFRRLLESQAVTRRYCQRTGGSGEFAVAQFAAGRFVNDFVQLRMAFANRHFPLRSGGLFEHGPRGGAATTHRLVPVTHAARTIGVLVAEAHFVTRRLLHFDLRPIGLKFIGNHHAQAGAHALAHFRTVAHHGDAAIGSNAHVNLGVVDPAIGHAIGAKLLRSVIGQRILPAPARGEDQRTSGADAFEKTTAAEVAQGEIIRDAAHAFTSFSWVEAWRIAVLIRL